MFHVYHILGDLGVCDDARRCTGGDLEVHEEPSSNPGEERRAYPGRDKTVLHTSG